MPIPLMTMLTGLPYDCMLLSKSAVCLQAAMVPTAPGRNSGPFGYLPGFRQVANIPRAVAMAQPPARAHTPGAGTHDARPHRAPRVSAAGTAT